MHPSIQSGIQQVEYWLMNPAARDEEREPRRFKSASFLSSQQGCGARRALRKPRIKAARFPLLCSTLDGEHLLGSPENTGLKMAVLLSCFDPLPTWAPFSKVTQRSDSHSGVQTEPCTLSLHMVFYSFTFQAHGRFRQRSFYNPEAAFQATRPTNMRQVFV